MVIQQPLKKSWTQKEEERRKRQAIRDMMKARREEQQRKREEAVRLLICPLRFPLSAIDATQKKRAEARRKQKLENEKRAEVVQVISNNAKIKKMSREARKMLAIR